MQRDRDMIVARLLYLRRKRGISDRPLRTDDGPITPRALSLALIMDELMESSELAARPKA
jgi:hypothetical protein